MEMDHSEVQMPKSVMFWGYISAHGIMGNGVQSRPISHQARMGKNSSFSPSTTSVFSSQTLTECC